MKLNPPIKDFSWQNNISQMFGVNSERYQKDFGEPAHQGLDIYIRTPKLGYGEKIYSAHTRPALVTKVVLETKTRTTGNGVYLQETLEDGRILETIYWHISSANVQVGEVVSPQKPLFKVLALVGNSGYVSPLPTKTSPYRGSHLHFAVRLYDKEGRRIPMNKSLKP